MKESISRRNFIRWSVAAVGATAAVPLLDKNAEGRVREIVEKQGEGAPTVVTSEPNESWAPAEATSVDTAMLQRLIAPVAVGTRLGSVQVLDIAIDSRGAGLVTLGDKNGETWNAEICRRTKLDANVRPLVTTRHYTVFLCNNGNGSVPTNEQIGRAVVTLGARVKKNENSHALLPLPSRRRLWKVMSYQGGIHRG